jgi:2-oxoisovalerate dehydrogenase E2 component (dihydrolipoyl transacylase)
MSEYVFKLPDLGEGTVDAEIVEWHVQVGAEVKEGDIIVDVMTDKANVEVPAPVDGRVLRTSGQPGDLVAVGAELIALEVADQRGAAAARPAASRADAQAPAPDAGTAAMTARPPATAAPPPPPERTMRPADASGEARADDAAPADEEWLEADRARVITSPAIRRHAKEAGIDLRQVAGSGPRGRILRRDLEAALAGDVAGGTASGTAAGNAAAGKSSLDARTATDAARATDGSEFEAIKVIGVRRVIAERMAQSKREIPHFSYVEEVDVTELERLRRHLNERFERRLSVLPFIALGLIRALEEFPQCNARFDSAGGQVQRWRSVHLGIATQTRDGLKVPVVRRAERLDLWQLAEQIAGVAEAARSGQAKAADLGGSTITITSLGPMGGIVTTPVVNHPEVAIIGVNKVVDRPVVIAGQVCVRTMMNLSSSFDHRFVDGYDAAAMIQRVKALLEQPAALFLAPPARISPG